MRLAGHIRLDRMGDVTDIAAQSSRSKSLPHRLLGDPHEFEYGGLNLTDCDRDRRIAMPAVHDRATVDRDHIAIVQDPISGDAVHHFIIDRGADGRGEGRIAISQKRRDASTRANGVFGKGVETAGRDPGSHGLANELESASDEQARDPHLGDLIRALDLDAALTKQHPRTPQDWLTASSAAMMRSVTSSMSPMPSTSISKSRSR